LNKKKFQIKLPDLSFSRVVVIHPNWYFFSSNLIIAHNPFENKDSCKISYKFASLSSDLHAFAKITSWSVFWTIFLFFFFEFKIVCLEIHFDDEIWFESQNPKIERTFGILKSHKHKFGSGCKFIPDIKWPNARNPEYFPSII